MRGLRKYLTPFAPDQSGAVSVLYELGGIVVVCDAGGCTGNICGFDEPRWHTTRSAVFSAGLRDMDAILGRDDKLVSELADAATKMDVRFAAIVGTPVPAVIGTDYRALRRMAERACGLPTITVDTTGTRLYDEGASKAYLALFDRFATERLEVVPGRVGIIGANPLDLSEASAEALRVAIPGAVCYGMAPGCDGSGRRESVVGTSGRDGTVTEGVWSGETERHDFESKGIVAEESGTQESVTKGAGNGELGFEGTEHDDSRHDEPGTLGPWHHGSGLDNIVAASSVERNVVVAPSGLATARLLKERFGTPYEFMDPRFAGRRIERWLPRTDSLPIIEGARILVIRQQVSAHSIRKALLAQGAAKVVCATWFMQVDELTRPGDVHLAEEDDLAELVREGDFDILIGDPAHWHIVRDFEGTTIDLPEFPVSGRLWSTP